MNPFAADAVTQYMHKYTRFNKTSGMSGVPNELLLALVQCRGGLQFLLEHLTGMLQDTAAMLADLSNAFVCLIPKKLQIACPHHLRPIALMEATLKLFAGLSFRRWIAACARPAAQKGALAGSQLLSCLWSSQQLLYLEYKTSKPALWLLVDVQQAFDSQVSHLAVFGSWAS